MWQTGQKNEWRDKTDRQGHSYVPFNWRWTHKTKEYIPPLTSTCVRTSMKPQLLLAEQHSAFSTPSHSELRALHGVALGLRALQLAVSSAHSREISYSLEKNIIIVVILYNGNLFITWSIYRQTSNIRCTLVGNKIVDHSDVAGASPIGDAPTTSSFSTEHLVSMDWAKTTASTDENNLSFGIWCVLY